MSLQKLNVLESHITWTQTGVTHGCNIMHTVAQTYLDQNSWLHTLSISVIIQNSLEKPNTVTYSVDEMTAQAKLLENASQWVQQTVQNSRSRRTFKFMAPWEMGMKEVFTLPYLSDLPHSWVYPWVIDFHLLNVISDHKVEIITIHHRLMRIPHLTLGLCV